jgi:hypothetical protein
MTVATKSRFSFTAFTIAATTVVVLNGTMLMGFEHLASNGHDSIGASTRLAKSNVTPVTFTLERVVISTRRV